MRAALILCLFLIYSSLQAQKFELTSTHFTTRDGLAGDNVYCAFQDKDGYIWFGTETGVSRYNGREFENFYTSDGLADNEVYHIFQDSKERIWFSALNGKLSYFKDGKFYNQTNDPFLKNISLESFFARLFEDSSGRLWFSTREGTLGVLHESGDYEEVLLRDNPMGWILAFKEVDEDVFGLHRDLGLIRLSSSGTLLNKPEIILEDRNAILKSFTSMINDMPAFLALGWWGSKRYVSQFSDFSEVKREDITKLNHYPEELWVCSNVGAYLVSKNDGQKKGYFEGNYITHVLKDREGNYWFTSQVNGVFYVPSFSSKSFTNTMSPMLNGVTSLKIAGDDILFGGNDAVFGKIIKDSVRLNRVEGAIGRSMIKNIEEGYKPGQFFFASESGLIEVINDRVSRVSELAVKVIRKLDTDLFAVGTGRKLIILNSRQLSHAMGLKHSALVKVYSSNTEFEEFKIALHRNIWITDVERLGKESVIGSLSGTYQLNDQYELLPLDQNEWAGKRVNDVHVLSETSGVAIATHGDGLWLNTTGEWKQLSMNEGLRSDIVKRIWSVHPDTLWLATNKGINQVVLSEPLQVKSITITDGLISEDVHDIVIKDNQLIAATSEGISVIDINSWSAVSVPPQIVMKNIAVDGSPWLRDDIHIPYDHTEITLAFDGIHFRSLNRITYEYRLLGLDDNWRKTSGSQMSFADLGPGSYTFEVRALSAFGDKSAVASHSFGVTAPYWFKTWFWAVIIFCFSGGLFLTMRWIINRNKRKSQEQLAFQLRIATAERKALQSQLNPHFIFNSLNSIQRMVLRKNPKEAYNYLEKFSKLIRRVLDLSDTSLVSLEEELETIRLYTMLERLRLDDSFDFSIRVEDSVDVHLSIPNMILQPFVENAIWHGVMPLEKTRKGKIEVIVSEESSTLILIVSDNGVGRAFHQRANGKGTQITNELIRKYKGDRSGSVEILDLKEGESALGTEVRIKIRMEELVYD